MNSLRHYLKAKTFRIALIAWILIFGFLYVTIYLNNTQWAVNRAIRPVSDALVGIGFNLSDIKRKGECNYTWGGYLPDPSVRCRSDEIDNIIPFDASLQTEYASRAVALAKALEDSGWRQVSSYPATLADLQAHVGPDKSEHVEYVKRVGRTHCFLIISTDTRFASISLRFGGLQSRHFFIF